MKVLVSHDNYERFKRGELEKSDKNLSAMPPPLDMLVEVKSPDEDKDRIWHIEEDKQLLKVQVHNNGHNE